MVILIGSVFMSPWSLLMQTINGNVKAIEMIYHLSFVTFFVLKPQFIPLSITSDIPSIFHQTQTFLLFTGGKGSP